MREPAPFPDCRLPTAEHREGLYGLVMDACGLAALGLFGWAALLWCGGLS